MIPRLVTPVLFLVGLVSPVFPETDPIQLFREGNAAYREKDHVGARNAYLELVEEVPCATAHYNLATASYRAGRLGEAVLHFEKALRYRPRDADIRANLEFVRNQVQSRTDVEDTDILTRIVWSVVDRISMPEVCGLLTLVLWILGLSLSLRIVTRSQVFRRVGTGVFLLGLPALIISSTLFGLKVYEFEAWRSGIVLQEEVDVYAGPSKEETKKFVLREGHWVLLVQHSGKWTRIALPTGSNGWVPDRTIGEI